jgi:hypothetical protein
MSEDHEAEIRASVGAHQDLGPAYDDAVAEGLVERIGAEIDKRIDARLGWPGPPPPGAVGPPPGAGAGSGAGVAPETLGVQGAAVPQGYQEYPVPSGYPPAGYPPAGYPGYQGYQGYQGYPGYQAPVPPGGYQAPTPRVPPLPRSQGQLSVAMTVIALGSMALGVAGTAIVSHATSSSGQAFMVLLIWAAIAIINIAYARRR